MTAIGSSRRGTSPKPLTSAAALPGVALTVTAGKVAVELGSGAGVVWACAASAGRAAQRAETSDRLKGGYVGEKSDATTFTFTCHGRVGLSGILCWPLQQRAFWADVPYEYQVGSLACFPARGLPQSGSKGLSQSPSADGNTPSGLPHGGDKCGDFTAWPPSRHARWSRDRTFPLVPAPPPPSPRRSPARPAAAWRRCPR